MEFGLLGKGQLAIWYCSLSFLWYRNVDSWLASTDRRQDQQKKAAGCRVRQMDGKHEPDAEGLLGTGRPENGWIHFAGYEAGNRATGLEVLDGTASAESACQTSRPAKKWLI